jgi:hypothetical protein
MSVYEGPDARWRAETCQQIGRPSPHKYPIGEIFQTQQRQDFLIEEQGLEPGTHRRIYAVIYDGARYVLGENDIDKRVENPSS